MTYDAFHMEFLLSIRVPVANVVKTLAPLIEIRPDAVIPWCYLRKWTHERLLFQLYIRKDFSKCKKSPYLFEFVVKPQIQQLKEQSFWLYSLTWQSVNHMDIFTSNQSLNIQHIVLHISLLRADKASTTRSCTCYWLYVVWRWPKRRLSLEAGM